MAKPIRRLYSIADELLTTRAQTQKNNLVTDIMLFSAKFSIIDLPFTVAYQTLIDNAVNIIRDRRATTEVKELVDDKKIAMEAGKEALEILFKYAVIGFPDSIAEQRVFGQNQMDKARANAHRMVDLLRYAHGFANADPYKTVLMDIGYTQTNIDALLTHADNIETVKGTQKMTGGQRPVSTQKRIEAHNMVYKRMKMVSVCAQVVFKGDVAKIHLYQVYPSTAR